MEEKKSRWTCLNEKFGYRKYNGWKIILAALFGVVIAIFFVCLYGCCCTSSVSSIICRAIKDNPPWALLAPLATAPALLLFWYWRDRHKRADIEIDREGQITERFTRAIELLGNQWPAVKVGAIYALERISIDSNKDYWPIMETLSAFIRNNAPVKSVMELLIEEAEVKVIKPEIDVYAAVTVLGRRMGWRNENEHQRIDLSRSGLRGLILMKAQFSRAIIHHADLTEANLCQAQFIGADLHETFLNRAYLVGADFRGAKIDNVQWIDAKYCKDPDEKWKTKFPDGFDPSEYDMIEVDRDGNTILENKPIPAEPNTE